MDWDKTDYNIQQGQSIWPDHWTCSETRSCNRIRSLGICTLAERQPRRRKSAIQSLLSVLTIELSPMTRIKWSFRTDKNVVSRKAQVTDKVASFYCVKNGLSRIRKHCKPLSNGNIQEEFSLLCTREDYSKVLWKMLFMKYQTVSQLINWYINNQHLQKY